MNVVLEIEAGIVHEHGVAEAERVPSTLDRSLAVFVRVPGGESGVRQGSPDRRSSSAIEGDVEMVAEHLAGIALLGVGDVQLVVDPITVESIEWLGEVLAALDTS